MEGTGCNDIGCNLLKMQFRTIELEYILNGLHWRTFALSDLLRILSMEVQYLCLYCYPEIIVWWYDLEYLLSPSNQGC